MAGRSLRRRLRVSAAFSYSASVSPGRVRRATAVAARYLGLDCHLLLRTSKALVDKDPGLVGERRPRVDSD